MFKSHIPEKPPSHLLSGQSPPVPRFPCRTRPNSITRSDMASHLHIFAIHVFPGHVFHERQLENFRNILGLFMQAFQIRVCRISVPENLGFLLIEVMGLVGIRVSSPESQVIPVVPLDHVPRMPGSTDRPMGREIACTGIPKLRITETVILE